MKTNNYIIPQLQPITVAIERGFAASAEVGFDLPTFREEDLSNNWK